MDKLLEQNPVQFKLGRIERVKGEVISKEYLFPKRFVTIRSKDIKRNLSDEEKKELSERMKNIRGINSTL